MTNGMENDWLTREYLEDLLKHRQAADKLSGAPKHHLIALCRMALAALEMEGWQDAQPSARQREFMAGRATGKHSPPLLTAQPDGVRIGCDCLSFWDSHPPDCPGKPLAAPAPATPGTPAECLCNHHEGHVQVNPACSVHNAPAPAPPEAVCAICKLPYLDPIHDHYEGDELTHAFRKDPAPLTVRADSTKEELDEIAKRHVKAMHKAPAPKEA